MPTLLLDAVTHRRVDVLPDRKADTLTAWLREHPQVTVVCRDGSATYAEAIRDGAPLAIQVSHRWHLWKNLGKAVEKTVIAHSGCWQPSAPSGQRPSTNAPASGTPPCTNCLPKALACSNSHWILTSRVRLTGRKSTKPN